MTPTATIIKDFFQSEIMCDAIRFVPCKSQIHYAILGNILYTLIKNETDDIDDEFNEKTGGIYKLTHNDREILNAIFDLTVSKREEGEKVECRCPGNYGSCNHFYQ